MYSRISVVGADVGAGQVLLDEIRPCTPCARRISRPHSEALERVLPVVGIGEEGGVDRGLVVADWRCASVTEPMLCGRRLQVLIVIPWPLIRIRPWSMTYAGRQWIWMSGDRTSGLRYTNTPASAHARGDRSGLVEQVLDAVASAALSQRSVAVVADRRGLGREVDVHVVLEVLADARAGRERPGCRAARSSSAGPIPDSSSSRGEFTAPPDTTTSPPAVDPRLGRLVLGEVLHARPPGRSR